MNNTVQKAVIFVAGVAVGGLSAWQYLKAKYDKKFEVEIQETKERFMSYLQKDTEIIEKKEPTPDPKSDISTIKMDAPKKEKVDYHAKHSEKLHHYVIDPNDLGEKERDGYQCVSFTHYSDDVLVDETFDPVINIDDIVGIDYKTHLGEFEDDSVCIRNDKLKLDIQIIFDPRKYEELVKKMPTRLRPEE